MPVTDSQAAPLTQPRKRKPRVSPRENVLAGIFRKKYGIAPRGPGPHANHEYGLPLPPATHPAARKFAKVVMMRARLPEVQQKYGKRNCENVLKRAKTLIYGSPNPTKTEVDVARAAARMRRNTAPHREQMRLGLPEPVSAIARASKKAVASIREAAGDPAKPAGVGVARVVLIREGPGNLADRHWYTAAALEAAAPLFEGCPAYLDHPTATEENAQPERSVRMMCGYYDNVSFDDFEDPKLGTVKALYADFHPEIGNLEALGKLRTAVAYAEAHPGKAYIGFSINALGGGQSAEIEGEEWNRVDEISEVNSVDIVTRAGAGGTLLTFKEQHRMAVRSKDPVKMLEEAKRIARRARRMIAEAGSADGVVVGIDQAKLKEGLVGFTKEDRKKFAEALKKKMTEATAQGATLSSDDIDTICTNLGIDPDGAMGSLLDQAAGVVDDGSEDDVDEAMDPDEEDPTEDPTDDDEETPPVKGKKGKGAMGEVETMSLQALQAEVLALRNAAATAKTESARNAKVAESAKRQLTEVQRAARVANIQAVMNELGIPPTFQPRVASEQLACYTTREALVKNVADFKAAYVTPFLEAAGAPGRFGAAPIHTTAPKCLAD